MITFEETLHTIERLAENLKSASKLESRVKHTAENLKSLRSMMEYSHRKRFRDVDEALRYIDSVLIPQLNGILDAMESGTEEHFKRLETAGENARRLALRLQFMVDDSGTDILP